MTFLEESKIDAKNGFPNTFSPPQIKEEVTLPDTMRFDKILKDNELNILKTQWSLFKTISTQLLPNTLSLRNELELTKLPKGTLIHGTVFDIEKLKSIKKYGIISGEFIGIREDNETHYCADFFRVTQDLTIKEYIDQYSQFEPGESIVKIRRMEGKYLPNKDKNNIKLGFIVDINNKMVQDLIKMDAYNLGFEKLQNIVNLPIERNDSRINRIAAILCGIPSNCISGLIISPKISHDQDDLTSIKEIFGDNILYFDLEGNKI